MYPSNKPCPPSTINEPNNFWGPLLASLTIFLDQLMAPFPFHQAQQFTVFIATVMASEIWTYTRMVLSILDFSWAFTFLGLIFVLELARSLWSAWIFLKRTIPFLGG